MSNFQLMKKQFIKDRFLSVFTSIFFFASIGYALYSIILCYTQSVGALDYLSQTLRLSIFSFVFFMFISNEYLYKITQFELKETVRTTKKGYISFYFSGFSVLVFFIFLYTISLLIINTVVYAFLDIESLEYLLHIVKNIIFNIFFVSLIGILIGGIVSFIKMRIIAYLLLIMIVFLSSPAFDLISTMVFDGTGVSVFGINDFFNIFPPLLQWEPLTTFGYSLLQYRIELALFYFLLCIGILVLLILNNRQMMKKSIAFICFIGCIICLFGYFQPASKVTMSHDPNIGAAADAWHYRNISVDELEPNFSVERYELDININRQLEVQATLFLNENELKDYTFTLYHGYIIKEITNQEGQVLNFSQKDDYFTVNSASSLKSIKIIYSGSAPKFFSNRQGTSLPGWFAYYPHPGKLRMFNSSEQSFERILCPEDTEFSVKVNSNKEVYCNLDKTAYNRYSGVSNALTLVSGFYKTIVYDGAEIFYPYLAMGEFSQSSILDFVKQYKSEGIIKKSQTKIFVLPNTNNVSIYERFCGMEDHITLRQFVGLPMIFEMQQIPSYKLPLYNAYNYYKNDAKAFYDMANYRDEIYQQEGMDIKDIYVLLNKKLKELDEKYVEEHIEIYLTDAADKRDAFDFLNELKR